MRSYSNVAAATRKEAAGYIAALLVSAHRETLDSVARHKHLLEMGEQPDAAGS